MNRARIARFYLDDGLRQSAIAGDHNFIARVSTVLRGAGYGVQYCPNTPAERAKSAHRQGYSLFHMDAPLQDRALTFRRVYHYPFWGIEPSNKRWEWHVARSDFTAHSVPRKPADRFYAFWQKRLFPDIPVPTKQGFVYVPLQGRLLDHRSFQQCSPLDMVRAVLDHDPDRPVVATFHPKETYSPSEVSTFRALAQENPRLTLRTGGMLEMLATCDYIVTQNSGVAFDGMFFAKPAALFGEIDFHHVSAKVSELGVAGAIKTAPTLTPDYAGYVHWFWQVMSINAGHPEAERHIHAALSRAGWPM